MHTSVFFKLFPPPKFISMKHAGIDISDDSIHVLEFNSSVKGRKISKFGKVELPPGLIEGGDIKRDIELEKILKDLDKKFGLNYVKVSLPEEKVYLFQTEVPPTDFKTIEQNIESKLEANVPLSAPDCVFYFDLWPSTNEDSVIRATVSVVPRAYVENIIGLLRRSGMSPTAFEVVPKSIARSIIPETNKNTQIVVNMMNKKTGLYVVSGGIVCFTSTVPFGARDEKLSPDEVVEGLSKEINRVHSYWMTHGNSKVPVDQICLVGRDSPKYEDALQNVVETANVPVKVVDAWGNCFDLNHYIPPVAREDSLDYAVAAGLALL